ncbi:Transcription initiation factor TFIID subunit 11 [Cladobotryum mycophilum]|uniref:Transcription initiation factor TFIID subunit 11 n=1 Tax=Cladobotryum mycophilum TaxID=491253 RepID=A0ABR0SPG9_9HYPO
MDSIVDDDDHNGLALRKRIVDTTATVLPHQRVVSCELTFGIIAADVLYAVYLVAKEQKYFVDYYILRKSYPESACVKLLSIITIEIMASPPYVSSPSAMSPPYPSPAQIPNKKRSSTLDVNGPPGKRRKGSIISQTSGISHPLRQTSFPPEAGSPYPRSPSVDAASHVSGSVVSATAGGASKKKKRGRKAKNTKGDDSTEKTPSLVGGKAATTVSGQGGDKELEDDDDDEKAEMALEDVVARTQEQKQEEIRLRAMLVEAFDSEQYSRYELWRAAKLSDAVVKRVVNATVSQSVPQMVATAVKAVAKLFAGEIIEAARNVQAEWIVAGEKQSELPTPPPSTNEGENDEEIDLKRGPLRPDHLREAWRRYKMCGESHGVGVQQLWHAQQGTGVERFSTRTRTRLFK